MRRFALWLLLGLLAAPLGFAGEPEEVSPSSDGREWVASPLSDEQARVAELQRRIECQDARIRQLEARAAAQGEDGEVLIPFIRIQARFGPNLLYWRDRLWEMGGGAP